VVFSKPSFFSRTTARCARAPVGQTTTSGSDLFLGRSRDVSRRREGTLRAPTAWPAAYSAGSLMSIRTAFSRLMRRTASAALTLPPPRPPASVGHRSSAPETSAVTKRYQLSRTKLKARRAPRPDPAKGEL
jgi:hypothetical protein